MRIAFLRGSKLTIVSAPEQTRSYGAGFSREPQRSALGFRRRQRGVGPLPNFPREGCSRVCLGFSRVLFFCSLPVQSLHWQSPVLGVWPYAVGLPNNGQANRMSIRQQRMPCQATRVPKRAGELL